MTPVWCSVHGDCTEAYCSESCRDIHQPAHSLVCTGGLEAGAPLREFSKLANRQPAQAMQSMLLASMLIAKGLAQGADAGWMGQWIDDEPRGDASHASSPSSSPSSPDEADEERSSAVDEGWTLLHAGLMERLSPHKRVVAESLLDKGLFMRLLATLERRAQPVQLANPLGAYCAQLSLCDASGSHAADAIRRLLQAVAVIWPPRAKQATGATQDASAQLDALLSLEAAEAVATEAALTKTPATAGDSNAMEVVAQRRACLLAQCAPRLFPPLLIVAVARPILRVAHSCVPSAQLQMKAHDAPAPALPTVALVALRPRSTQEAEPSVAWVDMAHATWDVRQAALRAKFGRAFECRCARCRYERAPSSAATAAAMESGGGTTGVCPLVVLARDAMEDGRLSEAIRMLRARVADTATDGEAWLLLGTALLNSERWTAAHVAWRRGATLDPSHPLLAQIRAKDEGYHPHADTLAPVATATTGAAKAMALECHAHSLPGGGHGCKVVVTRHPLFSAEECAAAVCAAEAHAAASGGWTTARHHAVPTTDIPIHRAPELLSWFREALATRLGPLLAANFGVRATDVRVHDAFLVRYSAGHQAHLPLHTDESMLSLTLVLNDSFVGGGTYFADLREALSPAVGHVVAFDGRALHGGEPIIRGTRYIVAAFLYVTGGPGREGQEGDDPGDAGDDGAWSVTGGDVLGGFFAAAKKRAREEAPPGDGDAVPQSDAASSFAFNFGF